jgi:hypothetical protein
MAKIRLFRYSGQPVEPAALAAYEADFKAFYDRASERAKLDMLKLNRFLRYAERILTLRHGAQVEIDMPTTAKKWAALVEKYQAPIMVAATAEDSKKLVAIIMDSGLG